MSTETETQTEIAINARAQTQLREMLAGAEKVNEQINTYVAALAAALDVPDGWRLDARSMAFAAPDQPVAPAGAGTGDVEEQRRLDGLRLHRATFQRRSSRCWTTVRGMTRMRNPITTQSRPSSTG